MIGVYYFKDGNALHQELNFLVDNDVIKSGEYQLPDALRRLTEKGTRFKPGEVLEWLDCGNKEVTVATNLRVLELDFEKGKEMVAPNAIIENSVVIPPCFIGENVRITNSVVGPHVSIGKGGVIHQSIVSNALIQENTQIRDLHLENSMIGSHVLLKGSTQDLSIGDYNCWNA
jgi:glucose-1-phosphate thymidylyltransferase